MPKVSRETRRMRIRRDLLAQLERNEIAGNHYEDLVEDYLALWDMKEKLISEVKKNGVMVKWSNGKQIGTKKNDAVTELPRVNKQMLVLFKELGLSAIDNLGEDDDEDL
ncbi:P27 family phage terminase small subunit [Bacillus cereus group sp. RP43]|uniref:P27 family phage terminase small subunit n=1 Tax=Bacillus cereus group sp. RP43 TaxID=3040260 RepID=UPI003399B8E5